MSEELEENDQKAVFIKDGVVTSVLLTTKTFGSVLTNFDTCILVPESTDVGLGWSVNDGKFTPPIN
jgi:hypothetical protein